MTNKTFSKTKAIIGLMVAFPMTFASATSPASNRIETALSNFMNDLNQNQEILRIQAELERLEKIEASNLEIKKNIELKIAEQMGNEVENEELLRANQAEMAQVKGSIARLADQDSMISTQIAETEKQIKQLQNEIDHLASKYGTRVVDQTDIHDRIAQYQEVMKQNEFRLIKIREEVNAHLTQLSSLEKGPQTKAVSRDLIANYQAEIEAFHTAQKQIQANRMFWERQLLKEYAKDMALMKKLAPKDSKSSSAQAVVHAKHEAAQNERLSSMTEERNTEIERFFDTLGTKHIPASRIGKDEPEKKFGEPNEDMMAKNIFKKIAEGLDVTELKSLLENFEKRWPRYFDRLKNDAFRSSSYSGGLDATKLTKTLEGIRSWIISQRASDHTDALHFKYGPSFCARAIHK